MQLCALYMYIYVNVHCVCMCIVHVCACACVHCAWMCSVHCALYSPHLRKDLEADTGQFWSDRAQEFQVLLEWCTKYKHYIWVYTSRKSLSLPQTMFHEKFGSAYCSTVHVSMGALHHCTCINGSTTALQHCTFINGSTIIVTGHHVLCTPALQHCSTTALKHWSTAALQHWSTNALQHYSTASTVNENTVKLAINSMHQKLRFEPLCGLLLLILLQDCCQIFSTPSK